MTINNLIEHLDRFVSGSNISVQWAKDAETLLDEIEENEGFGKFENLFDELQEKLSLYRPGGGEHLIDEFEMKLFCIRVVSALLEGR
ncbi:MULTISPECIES: hypothetical protein [Pseudomonas]|uniref:Colicin D immunity protein domain-containing protein n=3 Tax=Pseudomonas fluorescens group TaxID=136843 RepID=A0A3M4A4F9_PSEMA|nr:MULTISPECIES: hypothetical protein [Pseudomonas]MCD7037809.1 hypothetical protein [Pseudomonas petroselini]MCD7049060.1 hypothetical protein [Pseudomonas petroselini]MCD7068069.1 hypothetical protein [Pseudomonas petroselini]MCD7082577.1 hypothetical protein [Pseudomonas petroselini]OAJ47047.1 hypothetical protein AO064_01180 [Pseudomonas marginalis]